MTRHFPHYLNKVFFIGVDDGYFPSPKQKGKTPIAAVLFLGKKPRKTVLELATIDGTDATQKVVVSLKKLFREIDTSDTTPIILTDGLACCGFNFFDPTKITAELKAEIIVIFYRELDLEKIFHALKNNFDDWNKRYSVFQKIVPKTRKALTEKGTIYYYSDMDAERAVEAIRFLQLYSPIPEPVRIAHMVASQASLYLRRKGVI